MDSRLLFDQEQSGPLLKTLKEWMEAQLEHKIEPNSGLGKAIQYMLRHWRKPHGVMGFQK
jgi:hypothetical protein